MPGIYIDTVRRQNVVARGFTDRGDPLQIVGSGYLARCLQHENDHLDGVLFIDRMDTAAPPRRDCGPCARRPGPRMAPHGSRSARTPHRARFADPQRRSSSGPTSWLAYQSRS